MKPGSTQGGANGHSINSVIEAFETKSFGEFVKKLVENWFNSYNEKK